MNKILLSLFIISILGQKDIVSNNYIPINENESFFISYKNNLRKDVLNNENFDIVYKLKI